MKKISVIVQEKDADSCIDKLRGLGVLHVEHQRVPAGAKLGAIADDIALFEQAIAVLSKTEFYERTARDIPEPGDCNAAARHIIDMDRRYAQLQEYSLTLQSSISQWQRWGDFDPAQINNLGEKNIYFRLYRVPAKEIKNLPAEAIVRKISSSGGIVNCVVISREKLEIPFPELNPPKMGLAKMRSRLKDDILAMEGVKKEISKLTCYRRYFRGRRQLLEKELEFHQVKTGMGQAGIIMYLGGYAPVDALNLLLEVARKEKWGIMVGDPSENDTVPTLVRNPRWVSLISPVFKIIEVIPGYREFDISFWFLLFLSVFFGLIIADAGYGMTYFFIALFAQLKFGRKMRDKKVFFLVYLLSLSAVIVGILSATFFGQEWLKAAGAKPLAPIFSDSKAMRSLCFLIGAIHLSVAHLWKIIIVFPSLVFLADLGWILILWTAFFLARVLILGAGFPGFSMGMLACGMVLVVLFSNPRRNIFQQAGLGLGTLALNLMNNFTDVVSYIRLFAVGLAGIALADAFNAMAADILVPGFLGVFLRFLVLVAGHSLNIILGPMSVLVHGVRLNILEFASHLDLQWSGFAYKPLRENAV